MNKLLATIMKKRKFLSAIIVIVFIAILSRAVNELGVNYVANQQERKNGIIVGAEPIFIQKNNDIGILLIHGFTSSPGDFRELANFLAEKNITVYVPLLPGHGTHPRDLKKIEYQDWINSAQQSLNLLDTKKKFVLGYSMGGTLALSLAAENNLEGVISINSAIFLANRYVPFIPLMKLVQAYTAKRAEDIIQFIDEKRVVYDSMPLGSVTELQKLINTVQLRKISEPILIFQSDHDKIISPESADYIYNEVSSKDKALISLENSTHSKLSNQEEAFNTVYEFILAH
ncbi:alpha/beta fold hydrolase [Candidatus Woesearchaeota archaeon]|nr:alpha/beta fold hydrolase [Candidatus Woesearchaeota archaeon]